MSDQLGKALGDLDEVRSRIDTVREALQAAVQGCDEKNFATVRQLVAKLERMAAEVVAVEEVLAAHEGVAV